MKDIKSIVSSNLSALRKQKGITQAELAERLNYSDKAISRWEKGDTLPDLNVLYEICEFYGITMNDLTSEICVAPQKNETKKLQKMYRIWICILAAASVLLLATIWFVLNMVNDNGIHWIVFLWALPASCAVVMLIGREIFNWVIHFVLGSVVVWSAITSIVFHVQFFTEHGAKALWLLFLLGIPLQAMLLFFHMAWKSRAKVINKIEENKQNGSRTKEQNNDNSAKN